MVTSLTRHLAKCEVACNAGAQVRLTLRGFPSRRLPRARREGNRTRTRNGTPGKRRRRKKGNEVWMRDHPRKIGRKEKQFVEPVAARFEVVHRQSCCGDDTDLTRKQGDTELRKRRNVLT
eukprot:scaffold1396_cov252-Pinguiococcus_pyrenoidosus.AAC.32